MGALVCGSGQALLRPAGSIACSDFLRILYCSDFMHILIACSEEAPVETEPYAGPD